LSKYSAILNTQKTVQHDLFVLSSAKVYSKTTVLLDRERKKNCW